MKKLSFILLFILAFSQTHAQEYYAFGEKKILTKKQIDVMIKDIQKKMDSINQKRAQSYVISYTILKTFTRNDSVINKVKLNYEPYETKFEKLYSLVGKKFPDFKLRKLNSKRITQEDLIGKVTYINIWFTNCFPCVREIPDLNRLKKEYKDKVQFLSLTYDPKDKVQRFLRKKTFNFDHIINAPKFLKKDLEVKFYPKNVIIDKDGIVQFVGGAIPINLDNKTKNTEEDVQYLKDVLDRLLSS